MKIKSLFILKFGIDFANLKFTSSSLLENTKQTSSFIERTLKVGIKGKQYFENLLKF